MSGLVWRNARRIAARELRAGLRGGAAGFRVLLACLVLGTAAIAAIGTVRAGIERGLQAEGAQILGGDAEIELTYRSATAEELAWMAARATARSQVAEFRSMAALGEDYALTQVKAVDAAYPLIGTVALTPPMPLAEALAPREGREGAVMEPVLAERLGLKIGAEFTLGGQRFELRALLAREPDSAGGGIGFGPRTLVRLAAVEATPLLGAGALYEMRYRLLLPPETATETALGAFKTEAEAKIIGAKARDRTRAAGGVERFVERIGSFLVLVGLAGLAVGGVGIAQSTEAWAARKTETIATLKAIGTPLRVIGLAFGLQLALMVGLGVGLGMALGAGLVLGLSDAIARALPFPIDLALSWRAMAEAGAYGALVAGIFATLPLARLLATRPAALYREGEAQAAPRGAKLLVAALVAVLVALVLALSPAKPLAAAVLAGVAGSLAALSVAARGLARLARALGPRLRGPRLRGPRLRGHVALRMALAALGHGKGEASAVLIALGLGLSVLSAVGQVDAGLRGAIARDLPAVAPAFFLLDIQPDQIGPFKAQVAQMPQVTRMETAPMLRASITKINGAKPQGQHWVLRGDRGISYGQEVPLSTPLVAGEWWAKDYAGPPLVSFAQKEAEELGLHLGDRVTIALLGREITATIASFRAVDFSSAGMGFVMMFNPSALQGAPHSNIATLYTAPEQEAGVLRALARAYPNVTAIGVREALARLSEAMASIARATALAAGVTLATGFAVLLGAALAGERARAREAALLKTLGASRALVARSMALRVLLLGLWAALIALGIGALAAWAVLVLVMEAGWSFAAGPAAAILLGGVGLALFANLASIWRPLRLRPAVVLRAQE